MRLTRFEQHQSAIIGRAIMPLGVFGGLTDQRDIGAEITRQLMLMPWWSSIVVRLGLWVVWFAPLWRTGKLKLFGSLASEAQAEVLEKLARSNLFALREMIMLVKMCVCLAMIGDRKVLAYLGAYDSAGGPVALRRSGS